MFPGTIKKISGFSMLELSAVLAIIAVLMGSAISAGFRGNESSKITVTQNKIGKIEEALLAYIQLHKRMPCPAVGSTARSDTTLGEEDCTNTAQDTCAADCSANLRVGIVPVETLGLPKEFVFDGWDKRITYAVDLRFTNPNQIIAVDGAIQINGYADTILKSNKAVYALLSHGKNGHGAWPENGGTTRFNAGVAAGPEVQNADTIASEKSFNIIFRQALPASDFDDILVYKEKTQILFYIGGSRLDEACELAKRTLCPIDAVAIPRRGPVGCTVDGGSGYDDDCLDRQTQLARTIIESGSCFFTDTDLGDCR